MHGSHNLNISLSLTEKEKERKPPLQHLLIPEREKDLRVHRPASLASLLPCALPVPGSQARQQSHQAQGNHAPTPSRAGNVPNLRKPSDKGRGSRDEQSWRRICKPGWMVYTSPHTDLSQLSAVLRQLASQSRSSQGLPC